MPFEWAIASVSDWNVADRSAPSLSNSRIVRFVDRTRPASSDTAAAGGAPAHISAVAMARVLLFAAIWRRTANSATLCRPPAPNLRRRPLRVLGTPQLRNSGTDVGALDSGEVRRLLTSEETFFDVAYAKTGHLLFVRARTLYAQRFDETRLAVQGEPMPIANHVMADSGPGAMFSISANGVLVYRQEAAQVTSQLVWFDR